MPVSSAPSATLCLKRRPCLWHPPGFQGGEDAPLTSRKVFPMTNVLAKGLAWMHQQRAAHMASPAVYRRRDDPSAGTPVSVTPSQVRRELVDGNGMPVTALVMDFLVSTDALPWTPESGDSLEFNGRRYEVGEFGEDKCWRWTDASRLALRIHTRDVGEVGGA